jgi:hypothetical protein
MKWRERSGLRVRRPGFHLAQFIYHWVLESQLPQEIVNFIFQLGTVNNELTMCGGFDLIKLIDNYFL